VGVADIIGLAAAVAVAVATVAVAVACLPATAVETLAAPTVRGGGIIMSTEVALTAMAPVAPGVSVLMGQPVAISNLSSRLY
jgi:hypothetical protein